MKIACLVLVLLLFCVSFAVIPISAQTTGYIYTWSEDTTRIIMDSNLKVNKITTGHIVTGYVEGDYRRPIIIEGIQVEFKEQPSVELLESLDLKLSEHGLQRKGGITIADKIAELENEVALLKASSK